MDDGTVLDKKKAKAAFTESEAQKRPRDYDRTRNRPGVQLVNVAKVGRNDPCLCGSQKKFKHCCMA